MQLTNPPIKIRISLLDGHQQKALILLANWDHVE